MLQSTDTIRKIREYRQSALFDPGPNWPEDIARERSWQQVGCDTLLTRIRENPFAEPENIIEEFILQMDTFADKRDENYAMFKAYKEVGEQIMRLIK